jgi:hypothetical protein
LSELFDIAKNIFKFKTNNLSGPVFLKANSDAQIQREKLVELAEKVSPEIAERILSDIKLLDYGIAGEKNIEYELRNTHSPMIVIQDLRLEYQDLSAQIDYFIVTPYVMLVLECKNLYGNIDVNNNGDFIRTIEYNGKWKKEGIYSPVTQNRRHLEIIKKARLSMKSNVVSKAIFETYFEDNYKSLVILANPKTVINTKYAKKDIKDQIIRSDQLGARIKKLNDQYKKNGRLSEKDMYELAESYLAMHKPNPIDYTAKYDIQEILHEKKEIPNPVTMGSIEESPIFIKLKEFRLITSRQEGIKPYLIYNNQQLTDLIKLWPSDLVTLRRAPGFTDEKVIKYGEKIIEIFRSMK